VSAHCPHSAAARAPVAPRAADRTDREVRGWSGGGRQVGGAPGRPAPRRGVRQFRHAARAAPDPPGDPPARARLLAQHPSRVAPTRWSRHGDTIRGPRRPG
jgi:hypothetical protein